MTQVLSSAVEPLETSFRRAAPKLNPRMLTILLVSVSIVPPITIAVLWAILPPVKANQLRAEVEIAQAPAASYYDQEFADRKFEPNVSVVIRNTGNQPWTNINVRVNRQFNIYDHELPLEPGQQRSYLLSRFLSRGTFFDMRYSPVRQVLVYARLPDGSHATFAREMDR
jgi:hypothetical protein